MSSPHQHKRYFIFFDSTPGVLTINTPGLLISRFVAIPGACVLPEDYDFDTDKKSVPMQPGDVPVTYANASALERDFGFKPSTSLRQGLRDFAQWYKNFTGCDI